MHLPDSSQPSTDALALELLESARVSPENFEHDNPEMKAAFEQGLRSLAEDIVKLHPGLAHMLIGMSEVPCPIVHGQN